MSVRPAAKTPCAKCPWRTSNQGKRHPDGWYTKANIRRLWSKLRRGDKMTCHPTDPGNPVSLEAAEQGYKPAPEDMDPRECAGYLCLQQRELQIFNTVCKQADADGAPKGDGIKRYRKLRPKGLTRDGLIAVASRAVMVFPGELRMTTTNLLEEDIGHPDLPFGDDEIALVKETAVERKDKT